MRFQYIPDSLLCRLLLPKSTSTSSPSESFSYSFSSPSLSFSSLRCCSTGKDLAFVGSAHNFFILRFGTISHILASTDLNCCTKKEDILSDEALIEKNAVEIVKQMQRLKGIDGDYDSDSAASNRLAQRHTIQVNRLIRFTFITTFTRTSRETGKRSEP